MDNEIVKQNIPVYFEKLKTFEVGDDRFIRCKIWVAHTGVNKNNWIFTRESLLNAIPTLTNIPIVAFVQKNNDSENDFSDHREVLEIDKGKIKISYKGKAIGVVTSDNNAQLETKTCDDGIEREFLTCEGLLWTKFDDSMEIFMRDKCKDQSMEVDSYIGSFNKYKQFECTSFRFTGLCCLGCGVEPAMESACVDINFSLDEIKTKLELFNTSFNVQSQPQISDDINSNMSNTNKVMEGGQDNLKLTEEIISGIFAEFSLTREEVDFEINEETTEEALRELLTGFACKQKQEKFDAILAEFSVTLDELGEFANDITEEDFRTLVSDFATQKNANIPAEPETPETSAVFSTYNEKRNILRNILPHEEKRDDNGSIEYILDYWVADMDDNYVYVEKEEYNGDNWSYDKGRFGYSIIDNVASLTSEFEPMIVKWVTQEENTAIETARSNFEAQTAEFERLKQFEADTLKAQFEAKANAIFENFNDKLADVPEYDVLKTNFSSMELESIEEKCFALLGKKNANFSVKQNTSTVVNLGVDKENDEPEDDGYGGLLSRKYK